MKTHLTILLLFMACVTTTAQHKPNMPWIDLSNHVEKQQIIAQGTKSLYNGHPTTIMLDDNKTIFCTWSYNHGGKAGFLAKSEDAGKSWRNMETPKDWSKTSNCPSIYRTVDKLGKERLLVLTAHPQMSLSYSEDYGKSWSPVKSLEKPCIMAFASMVRCENGDYLGFYHRGGGDGTSDGNKLTLWQSRSTDGGVTWEESIKIADVPGLAPCEPYVFRAPGTKRLICVARENNRIGNSLMMTSDNEGATWSEMRETPWGLTGDRHVIKQTPCGRLVAVFRDMAPNSPTKGHFVAWVGTAKDLREETSGQYKIKLLHSYAGSDCGYPGLEILPDGTILAITYVKYRPGQEKHSIVATRFKLSETDAMIR
ncbi:MAG: sialidase family protein [Marinifilaceae bacterium]